MLRGEYIGTYTIPAGVDAVEIDVHDRMPRNADFVVTNLEDDHEGLTQIALPVFCERVNSHIIRLSVPEEHLKHPDISVAVTLAS